MYNIHTFDSQPDMPATKKGGYTLEQLLVPAALTATAMVARPALKIASNLTERASKSVRAAIPSSKMFSMGRKKTTATGPAKSKKTTKGGYETMNVLYGGNTESSPSQYPFESIDPGMAGGAKKRAKPKTKKATSVKKATTAKKATAKKAAAKKKKVTKKK
jgi:hypothetical protein